MLTSPHASTYCPRDPYTNAHGHTNDKQCYQDLSSEPLFPRQLAEAEAPVLSLLVLGLCV